VQPPLHLMMHCVQDASTACAELSCCCCHTLRHALGADAGVRLCLQHLAVHASSAVFGLV
jgi:hypothetical protein